MTTWASRSTDGRVPSAGREGGHVTSSLSTAQRVLIAATAVLLLALSVPLWPSAFGGSTSYVVPRGASMEPRVSGGDLAIVRSKRAYRVGDVAAYRNTALHRVVVHRIVAVAGDAYTFKGDANSFVDPQQVERGQIVGRLSLSIPLLGSVLLWLASPINALLLLVLVALLVRDRADVIALARSNQAAETVEPAPAPSSAVASPTRAVLVDSDRVVEIRDMSFPHELAVAEVLWPESMLALAERYDRPVLHDAAVGELFVVESSMLFRCVLEPTATATVPLSVVRDIDTAPTAASTRPAADVLPAEPEPVLAGPRTERAQRHNWPRRRDYGGRRRPSPYGRDWSYAVRK
jgi:signal peptidase I